MCQTLCNPSLQIALFFVFFAGVRISACSSCSQTSNPSDKEKKQRKITTETQKEAWAQPEPPQRKSRTLGRDEKAGVEKEQKEQTMKPRNTKDPIPKSGKARASKGKRQGETQ